MKKRLLLVCAVLTLALCAGPAFAAYTVDLGSSEPYPMADWSSINPDSIGGNWGGFGSGADNYSSPTTATMDYLCRTIWGQNDSRIATIEFPEVINSVTIRHLDGLAVDCSGGGGDDFEVYVDYVYWGKYVSDPATNEYWVETTFDAPDDGGKVLMLIATDEAWSGQATWGQVGIDRVVAVPEPVSIMLLGLGGLLLRKRRTL